MTNEHKFCKEILKNFRDYRADLPKGYTNQQIQNLDTEYLHIHGFIEAQMNYDGIKETEVEHNVKKYLSHVASGQNPKITNEILRFITKLICESNNIELTQALKPKPR